MSSDKIRIGVSQIPNSIEVEKNFESIMGLLTKFEKSKIDLILFPECSLSGFSSKMKECTRLAIEPYLKKIEKWSHETGIEVVLPTAIVEKGKIYNSGFWFKQNEIQQFYKIGLTESEIGFFSEPSKEAQKIFRTKNFNFALLICLEAQHEAWRYFKQDEADAILWPGYWGWRELDTWQSTIEIDKENLVYQNMKKWQIPLIQSNFSGNDLGDYRSAGPEGLSHVVNSDNSLCFRGGHFKVEGFVVELTKFRDGKSVVSSCEVLA